MDSSQQESHAWQRFCVAMLVFLIGMIFTTASFAETKPLIFMPFEAGSDWYVAQGQGGTFSHSWGNGDAYAYDFTQGSGNEAFGKDVLSPVTGQIVEIRDGVADWQNNSGFNNANHSGWGNTIVIKTYYDGSEIFIRMAHLRYGSTDHLQKDQDIEQGVKVAEVGQTGFSTNPHMHIQVQLAKRGASIDFDFVEGHPSRGDWVTSRLYKKMEVIDNVGRTNAGSLLKNPYTQTRQTWRYWGASSRYPTIGTYATSDDTDARYYWSFILPTGGRYDIYASCPAFSSRDSRAQYRFYGNGSSDYSTVDQRSYPSNPPAGLEELFYVDTVYPAYGGRQYKMRVRKMSSGRVCADAIFLRRR